jgi:hypothetical protein
LRSNDELPGAQLLPLPWSALLDDNRFQLEFFDILPSPQIQQLFEIVGINCLLQLRSDPCLSLFSLFKWLATSPRVLQGLASPPWAIGRTNAQKRNTYV